jgi:hypothetical protein
LSTTPDRRQASTTRQRDGTGRQGTVIIASRGPDANFNGASGQQSARLLGKRVLVLGDVLFVLLILVFFAGGATLARGLHHR